jgi:hypothetical protein
LTIDVLAGGLHVHGPAPVMHMGRVVFDSRGKKVQDLAVYLSSWVSEKGGCQLVQVGMGHKSESINLGHSKDNKGIAPDEEGNWVANTKTWPQSVVASSHRA